MRNSTVKMDADAFNRGVDEVLHMKPIVRVARHVLSGYFQTSKTAKDKPSEAKPFEKPARNRS